MIILEKDGTKLTMDSASDMDIMLNGSDSLSRYFKPHKEVHAAFIGIPVLLFVAVNIMYLFMYKDQTWFAEGVLMSLCIFTSFILSGITAYFIYKKNRSAALAWGAAGFLIITSSANVGIIQYSDITQKAMDKASSVIGVDSK
ncbi:TPA: hypothetical protein ACOM0E_005296 [Escherichia coli]|jgi:uncharacterized membrane protein|uniref:hypothetical protein n=1 Tax=Escherichia coli TaxID=562 RepID=UPI000482FCEA|nr:hypothetical protein [Escherichia coli]ELD6202413.1 hypothetical protein [Escherichia coli]HAH9177454.1 hypothetical protein [Escherichia coli]HAW1159446.1 hypothetical protein [Escherichia coli]HBC3259520.1 hypothetical protein [Escherichia coli]HCJ8339198.1 hypothetical protein [Escherichia coli]